MRRGFPSPTLWRKPTGIIKVYGRSNGLPERTVQDGLSGSRRLLYWFEAEGFNWARLMLLKADGSEHEIKLSRKGSPASSGSVRVNGTAVDEESGLPLDEFKVSLADVRFTPLTPEFRFRADGKDGKFSFSLSSPQLSPAYQVLVEKEGYLPTVSTNLFVKDGNQTLEFKL